MVLFLGTFVITKPVFAFSPFDPIEWMLGALSWIADLIASLLTKLIIMVIGLMTPVMLYNDFTTAPVVVQGWALVRDTVNMFFVIILIVIAFGTIFGHNKFKWQSQVPRLLLFAILINFSKTLAGIMIDFGQVIMLTFANALREIAAGNFVEMFGIAKVSQFSGTSAASNPTGQGTAAVEALLTSLAVVFILAWVLAILLLLLTILLYRVVALWVLIVIAPLAWFTRGAEILGSGAWAEWWSKFKCLVAIGPIVTFFLWLALAVAGAGTGTEGFEAAGPGNEGNFLTKIFEFQNFMSLIIGSALLLAGMQTAQDFCKAMGGTFLGKQLGSALKFGPDMASFGKGLVKTGTARAGRALGRGALGVGKFAGRELGTRMETKKGLRMLTTRGRGEMWRSLAGAAGAGVAGRVLHRFASKRAGVAEGKRAGEIAAAGVKFKDLSAGDKIGQLQRYMKAGGPKTVGGKLEVQSLLKDVLGDKDMQDKLRASGDLEKLWAASGKDMEANFKGDKKTMDQLAEFKKRHADITGSTKEIRTLEDAKNLSNKALLNPEIQAQLRQMEAKDKSGKKMTGTKDDGTKGVLTVAEAMKQGRGGTDAVKQAIMTLGASAYYDTLSPDQMRLVDPSELQRHAAPESMDRFVSAVASQGDFGRIQGMVTDLLTKYEERSTTDQDRFNINVQLDNVQGALRSQIDQGDLKGVLKTQAEAMISKMQVQRDAATQMSGTWQGGGAFLPNFGQLPSLSTVPDPSTFVQRNFAHASQARIDHADQQLQAQQDDKTSQRNERQHQQEERQTQQGTLLQAADDQLGAEIARLNQEREAAIEAVRQAVRPQLETLQQELSTFVEQKNRELRGLNNSKQNFEQQLKSLDAQGPSADPRMHEFVQGRLSSLSQQIDKAVAEKGQKVGEIQTREQQIRSADPAQSERVVQIDQEIALKMQQPINLSPETRAQVQQLQQEIEQTQTEIQRTQDEMDNLAQARQALFQLRPRP